MYENSKRKFKSRHIKIAPLSLALLLLFGLIAQASAGTGLPLTNQKATNQVVSTGGSHYYTEKGQNADASNYAVRVSKTVTQAAKENQFKVDLEVETPSSYKEVRQADSAVVLVLDVSGSMNDCATCGIPENGDILEKIEAAHEKNVTTIYCKDGKVANITASQFYSYCYACNQEVTDTNHDSIIVKKHKFDQRMAAAKTALKNFLKDYMENAGDYKRYFSIVTYSTTSDVFLGWRDTSKSNQKDLFEKIDALEIGEDTQTQLGMKKALGLLNQSTVADMQKSMILMTDGAPSPTNGSLEADPMVPPSAIPSEFQATYNKMITDYKKITNEPSGQEFWLRGYLTPAAYAFNLRAQGVPVYTVGFVAGRKAQLPLDWLTCFATKNFDAKDAIKLEEAFTELISLIDTRPDMVKDTLPPYLMFDRFDPTSSHATFEQATGITWTFPGAEPNEVKNGKNIYRLSYYVTLNNTLSTNTDYAMNENAPTFHFGIYKDGALTGKKHTVHLPIPMVKSLFGSLTFVKTDKDGNPITKTGGESAEFTLKLVGESKVSWTGTARNHGDGTVTFSNIPSGHAYELTETKAPTGYDKTDQVFRVTTAWGSTTSDIIKGKIPNNLSSEIKTLPIRKIWVDSTNDYQNHTVEFQVKCKDGNTLVRTVTGQMTKADQSPTDPKTWNTTIEVPTINPDTSRALSYEITETPIANYDTKYGSTTNTASNPSSLDFILIIQNERRSTQDFVVEKVWVDIDDPSLEPDHRSLASPSSASPSNSSKEDASPSNSEFRDMTLIQDTVLHPELTIKLYQGTTLYRTGTIPGGTSTTGSVTFEDVPLFDTQGSKYEYAITETSTDSVTEGVVTGYDTTEIKKLPNGYRITNTTKLSPLVTIPVHKHWYDDSDAAGKRPDSIDVVLYADRQDGSGFQATDQTITLSAEDGLNGNTDVWASSFKDLPRYTEGDVNSREEILYSVKEDPSTVPADYEVTYSGIDINNTLKTTSVTVRKVWQKPEGVDAPEVTFNLLQNDTKIDSATLPSGTTTHTFPDLEKKDASGNVYTYTVTEEPVAGYTLIKSEGTTFTNRIDSASDVTVSGYIRWDLRGDPESVLPETIKIQLYSGTTAVPDKIYTASKANDWKFEFTGLPRYTDDGLGFVPYSVRELGDGDVPAPDKSTIILGGINFGAHYDPVIRTQEGNFICNIFNHSDAEADGVFSSRIVLHYDAYRNDILSHTKVVARDTRAEEAAYGLNFNTNDYRGHEGKTYNFQKGTLLPGNSALLNGSNTVSIEKSDLLYEIHLYYTLHETGEVEEGGDKPGGGGGNDKPEGGGGNDKPGGGGGGGGGSDSGDSNTPTAPTVPTVPELPPNVPPTPETPPIQPPKLPGLTPDEQDRFDKVVEDATNNPDTIIRTPEDLQEKYPELNIDDLPVPLYACPEFVVIMTPSHEFVAIDDNLIPLGRLPRTGDSGTLNAVFLTLLGGLLLLVVTGFRKEKE